MVRRTKAEAEATRQQILDSAEQVFAEKGVLQTTMTDIASAAGVSRGAVYWHFASKLDVFNAMLSRRRDQDKLICAPAHNPEEPDPLGQMRNVLLEFFDRMANDAQHRRVQEILFLRCEMAGDMAPLETRLQEIGDEIDADIADTLNLAIQRGQLPDNLNVARAVVCCHGFVHGLMSNWLRRPHSFDLAAEGEALVDTLIGMLKNAPALLRRD